MSGIGVFAYSETGHACLRHVIDREVPIAFVATHADSPGEPRWFPSVAELARQHGIEPWILEDPRDPKAIERVRGAAPDVLLSAYYRRVLPAEMLRAPRLAAYNLHGSLLPKYRGRAPVNWAVLRGEKQTGATLHVMTARPDAGPIVDQEAVEIGPEDTAIEVQRRVTAAAVGLLERNLESLLAGPIAGTPQDDSAATTFRGRRPEDGAIDWGRPAAEVHDLVRAVTHPYPGAFSDVFGKKAWVWKTRLPGLGAHDNFPGQVRTQQGRLYVACGDDRYVEIVRLQREGEPEMDGSEYARRRRRTRP